MRRLLPLAAGPSGGGIDRSVRGLGSSQVRVCPHGVWTAWSARTDRSLVPNLQAPVPSRRFQARWGEVPCFHEVLAYRSPRAAPYAPGQCRPFQIVDCERCLLRVAPDGPSGFRGDAEARATGEAARAARPISCPPGTH